MAHISTRKIDNGHLTTSSDDQGRYSETFSRKPPKITVEMPPEAQETNASQALAAAKQVLKRADRKG